MCGLSGARGEMLQMLSPLVYQIWSHELIFWHLKIAFMQPRAELAPSAFSHLKFRQRQTMTAKILDASIVWLFRRLFMMRRSDMDK